MSKIALFPGLLVAGCLISGLYGAVHNQISYTVAPDYFHAFKFVQFQIPEHFQNRIGASIVGWQASWWMGLIIGIPVLLVALGMPDARSYLTRSLIAFAVVAATALVVGLGALGHANSSITASSLPDYWYPDEVMDKVAFARAGAMHNFSYLGGFLGIITGSLYLVIEKVRLDRRSRLASSRSDRSTVIGLVRRMSRPWYRVLMFILALVGSGMAVDAAITDSINQTYHHTHYLGSSILIWLGSSVGVLGLIEGSFLVIRRRLERGHG